MKTILVICKSYIGQAGGIYSVQNYVQVMLALGFKVVVITQRLPTPNNNTFHREENFEVKAVGEAFFDRHPFNWLRFKSRIRMLKATQDIVRFIKILEPKMIMVHGERPYFIYLRLKRYAPVAFFRHDAILTCPANRRFLPCSHQVCTQAPGLGCLVTDKYEHCLHGLSLFHKIGRILLRKFDLEVIKKFDYFCVNSNYVKKIHGNTAIVLYPSRKVFPQTSLTDSDSKVSNHVLFVGRLSEIKGVADALRIFERLPSQYSLTIIGDGPLRSDLEKYCKIYQLEGRVKFTGWLPLERVFEKMEQAGLTLVPSLWDEAFGMVGVESFACGTPVVAYDVGGISEWCRRPYGITVPCGAYEQAAEAVLQLTEDQLAWQDLCHQCAVYAKENFSKQKFEAQLKQFLEVAIASRD